jgi:hypothetical protein
MYTCHAYACLFEGVCSTSKIVGVVSRQWSETVDAGMPKCFYFNDILFYLVSLLEPWAIAGFVRFI